jgi:hypothetical protein
MENISKALVKAQSEMSNPVKGSNNPFFKSKYADLNSVREAILPVLNSNGIAVLQPTVSIEGKNYVKTVLLHESGETFEGLTEIMYNKPNDAQAQGSGISYARRYGLQSLVCVGAEDDDGNAATPQNNPNKKPEKTSEQLLNECKSLDELQKVYLSLSRPEQERTVALKDDLKTKLK